MYLTSFKKIIYNDKDIEYAAKVQANNKIERPGVFQAIYKFGLYRDAQGNFGVKTGSANTGESDCPPSIFFQREIIDSAVFKNLTEKETRECLYLAENFNLFESYSLDSCLVSFVKEPFHYRTDRRETVQLYYDEINMSFDQLQRWSDTKDSKKASLSKEAINRNLALMGKPEDTWDATDIINANKTINFLQRAKKIYNSKLRNSLMNWGYCHD